MRLGLRGKALAGVGALLALYAGLLGALQWTFSVRDECVSRLILDARYELSARSVEIQSRRYLAAAARRPEEAVKLRAGIKARLTGLWAMAQLLPGKEAGAARMSAAFHRGSRWLDSKKARMADRMARSVEEKVVLACLKSGRDMGRISARERRALLLDRIEAAGGAIFWLAWGLAGLTGLLALLATYWFTGCLLGNIRGLKLAIEEASSGRAPRPQPAASSDEMGDLVNAFDGLAKVLAESREHWASPERPARLDKAARSAAHMINNPLTAIIGYAELLMRADLGDGVKKDLRRIREQAERCHRAVETLAAAAAPKIDIIRR